MNFNASGSYCQMWQNFHICITYPCAFLEALWRLTCIEELRYQVLMGERSPLHGRPVNCCLCRLLLFFGFSGCKVCITGKIIVVINSQYHESTTAAFLYIKGTQNPQLGNSQGLQQGAS